MKNINHLRRLILPILLLAMTNGHAEPENLWQDMSSGLKSTQAEDFKHRRLQLDEAQLSALIAATVQQNTAEPIPVTLPLPDGEFIAVRLIPTALLSPEAQQMLPGFHTWRIESDDTTVISGRAELTELGFHAMLRTRDQGQIFIEPQQRTTLTQNRNYHSHSRHDNRSLNSKRRFSCGQLVETKSFEWQSKNIPTTAQRAGETLLTYDLAMAATGEYTRQFGGSKVAAQSAIVTTINRVNEIFEQELSIKLRLVDNSNIVFTNPATDPYSNGSATLLLYENQQVLDTLIGSQRYDIGHVLGSVSGGDGLAGKGVVCDNNAKAYGTTSSSIQLLSDAFIVDFVAHELGHQLGATHTFNSNASGSCSASNRTGASAHEPGSGSTIMSYAGICGSDNIQNHVDAQFHPTSILEIRNRTHNSSAGNCAVNTSLGNKLPTVNAGADYTIPARTPFILNGSASDSDGDKLLYSWDQTDAGSASALGVDTGNNALIKSSALAATPVRNVPNISQLLTLSQTSSRGESLPRSDRSLNFRLTVRDGNGAVSYDDKKLTLKDTGERFEILTPHSNISAGTQTITWNVAGTDQSPISCSSVDIAYTNDQGKTFTDLLTNTPNDGSASVQLTQTAQRIRVKCRNNIFFALSGTAPHIATYNNDSSQDSGSDTSGGNNTNDDGNTDDGGGGSLPTGLLAALSLLLLFSRKITGQTRNL